MSKSLCWVLAGAAAAVVLAPLLLIAMVTVTTPAVGQQLAEQHCAAPLPGSAAGGRDAAMRFTIGTLNWRGAAHYHRNPHPRETPYAVRAPHMIDKISAAGASIIGFQEFEKSQARDFLRVVDSRWALVRGRTATGRPDPRNAIAYQPDRWHLDQVRFLRIPYGRLRISIPLARFTARHGAATIWVLNSHDPTHAVGGTPAVRDAAVRTESTALRRLATEDRAEPVLFTGDMNDHARFKRLFLHLAGSGWTAANPTTGQIDWIIGGPGIRFTDTVIDHSTKDGAHHYTDPPFVHTVASLLDTPSGRTRGRPTAGQASAAGGAAPTKFVAAREGGLGFPLPAPGRTRLASLHTPAASIPPAIKTVYLRAAARYQLPWTLLAGIGMEETDHGRNLHTSSAGARGLMQFLPATFTRYGVDGDHDGHADITNPADSAMSAANYLTAAGVAQRPAGVRRALYAYNHADWYVNDVLYYAHAYGDGTPLGDPTDCGPTAGSAIGNPALPPLTSSRLTSLLRWAQAQLGEPYVYGANGPNAWDCSSYTQEAYSHIGITLPRTAQAQRDWLAAGNGYRIPLGQERPGDLVFTNTYLGPARVGHVMIVFNPAARVSIEAVGSHVQYDHYTRYIGHHIFEIWRVGNLADHPTRNG